MGRACQAGLGDGGRISHDFGADAVGPAGRGGPFEVAGFGLFQPPAGDLFDLVMGSAQRGTITFAGPTPPTVGDCVIQVTLDGRPPTAGERASLVTHLDQVPQPLRRLVAGRFPLMRAVAGREPAHPDHQFGATACGRSPARSWSAADRWVTAGRWVSARRSAACGPSARSWSAADGSVTAWRFAAAFDGCFAARGWSAARGRVAAAATRRAAAGWVTSRRCAAWHAAGAAVPDRPTNLVGHGNAPAGRRVCGGRGDKIAHSRGVQWAEPGRVARHFRFAQQRPQRDSQVH